MELISNYEDAMTHMDDGYSTAAHFWDHEDTVMKLPWIITDDLWLTLKYRNAFTEDEFKLWCAGDHINIDEAHKGYKWTN